MRLVSYLHDGKLHQKVQFCQEHYQDQQESSAAAPPHLEEWTAPVVVQEHLNSYYYPLRKQIFDIKVFLFPV